MTEENRKRIEAAAQFAASLCMYAGKDQAFYDGFWQRLLRHTDILAEFVYYMEHQDFLCRAKIEGRTVVDIMVWQVDHFKATLDRGYDMRCNKDKMLLLAFDTMLKMAEDPEPYITRMLAESGQDFEIK